MWVSGILEEVLCDTKKIPLNVLDGTQNTEQKVHGGVGGKPQNKVNAADGMKSAQDVLTQTDEAPQELREANEAPKGSLSEEETPHVAFSGTEQTPEAKQITVDMDNLSKNKAVIIEDAVENSGLEVGRSFLLFVKLTAFYLVLFFVKPLWISSFGLPESDHRFSDADAYEHWASLHRITSFWVIFCRCMALFWLLLAGGTGICTT